MVFIKTEERARVPQFMEKIFLVKIYAYVFLSLYVKCNHTYNVYVPPPPVYGVHTYVVLYATYYTHHSPYRGQIILTAVLLILFILLRVRKMPILNLCSISYIAHVLYGFIEWKIKILQQRGEQKKNNTVTFQKKR